MTPASRLTVEPGERVLDLCAAPGGKATELGARLHGEGLLVANDISASRAKALLKNIEVFGIGNSFVVNEVPAKLAEHFPEFFDKILVDAPCSGEGMFRKDPAAVKAWDAQKPFACAKQQREIVTRAAEMLAPGGTMLYSTCTFSPEENEQTIQYLLDTREDMELLDIRPYEGFAPGIPEAAYEGWETSDGRIGSPELKKCVRIWPHRMAGEGHFLALLHKKAEDDVLQPADAGLERQRKKDLRPGKQEGRTWRLEKADAKALEEFFADLDRHLEPERIEVRKGQVYYVPKGAGEQKGLVFLRNGLYVGEIRKGRFEPSQSLAMALRKGEYRAVLDLDAADDRVERYLRGETIEVDDLLGDAADARSKKGWQLVCVNGYPLGWGKLVNGTLKNKYHPGWRKKY